MGNWGYASSYSCQRFYTVSRRLVWWFLTRRSRKETAHGASQPRFGTLSYMSHIGNILPSNITRIVMSNFEDSMNTGFISRAHWRKKTIWFWPLFVVTITGASHDQEVDDTYQDQTPTQTYVSLRWKGNQLDRSDQKTPAEADKSGIKSLQSISTWHITINIHMICGMHNTVVYGIVYAIAAIWRIVCVCCSDLGWLDML